MKIPFIVFHAFNGGICFSGLNILIFGVVSGLSENVYGSDGSDIVMRQVDCVLAVLGIMLMLMSCLGYVEAGNVRKVDVTCRGMMYITALSVLFWALIGAGSFLLYCSYKFKCNQQLNMFDNMLFYWNTRIPGTLQRVAYVDKVQKALKCCGFHDKYVFPDIPKHGLPGSCCADTSMLDINGACPEEVAYEDGCAEKSSSSRTVDSANFGLGIVAVTTAGFVLSTVIFNLRWKQVIWRSLQKNKTGSQESVYSIGSI